MFLLLCSCMFLGINMPSFLFFFLLFLHLKGLLFQFRCACIMTIKIYDTIDCFLFCFSKNVKVCFLKGNLLKVP